MAPHNSIWLQAFSGLPGSPNKFVFNLFCDRFAGAAPGENQYAVWQKETTMSIDFCLKPSRSLAW
jgi:hypothetical protein